MTKIFNGEVSDENGYTVAYFKHLAKVLKVKPEDVFELAGGGAAQFSNEAHEAFDDADGDYEAAEKAVKKVLGFDLDDDEWLAVDVLCGVDVSTEVSNPQMYVGSRASWLDALFRSNGKGTLHPETAKALKKGMRKLNAAGVKQMTRFLKDTSVEASFEDEGEYEETAMKAYKPRRKTGKKVGRRSAKERQELVRKRKAKRAETRRKRAAYYKKNRAALLKRAARRRKMMKGKPVKKKDPNAVYTYK